jgi:predicted amidophosphoribosyltransferase
MSNRPIASPLGRRPLYIEIDCTAWGCTRLSSHASRQPAAIAPALVDQLISLLAPPLCAACGSESSLEEVLCATCEAELAAAPVVIEPAPRGVGLAVSASPFDGVARRVVIGLKYGRRLALARVAASAMLRVLPQHVEGVVPVPPGPWRWRWRGFDPAEEIAVELARLAGLPLEPCLRRGRGRRQVGRPRWERLADPPRIRLEGRPPAAALLVDDVWTTGATLSACARALRSGGCRRVTALTLARTV